MGKEMTRVLLNSSQYLSPSTVLSPLLLLATSRPISNCCAPRFADDEIPCDDRGIRLLLTTKKIPLQSSSGCENNNNNNLVVPLFPTLYLTRSLFLNLHYFDDGVINDLCKHNNSNNNTNNTDNENNSKSRNKQEMNLRELTISYDDFPCPRTCKQNKFLLYKRRSPVLAEDFLSIPKSLKYLQKLELQNVLGLDLSRFLQDVVSQCSSLRSLAIHDTALRQQQIDPKLLSLSSSLRELRLESCQLCKSVNFSDFPSSLRVLSLFNNLLTGSFPSFIKNNGDRNNRERKEEEEEEEENASAQHCWFQNLVQLDLRHNCFDESSLDILPLHEQQRGQEEGEEEEEEEEEKSKTIRWIQTVPGSIHVRYDGEEDDGFESDDEEEEEDEEADQEEGDDEQEQAQPGTEAYEMKKELKKVAKQEMKDKKAQRRKEDKEKACWQRRLRFWSS